MSQLFQLTRAQYNSSAISAFYDHSYRDIINLLCLRILFVLRTYDNLHSDEERSDHQLWNPEISWLLADAKIRRNRRKFNRSTVIRLLLNRWRRAEIRNLKNDFAIKGLLGENIKRLQTYLSLNETERRLLVFFVLLNVSSTLNEISLLIGKLDAYSLRKALHTILSCAEKDIDQALHQRSALSASGLLRIDRGGNFSLKNKVDVVEGLIDALLEPQQNVLDMLRHYFYQAREANFKVKDFAFIREDINLLIRYLKRTTQKSINGVNILIYGEPGTGKTELVHTIAQALKCNLFVISMETRSGRPLSSEDRFAAFYLSQNILKKKSASLILFDEIEDVVHNYRNPFIEASQRGRQKAWINNLLENNPIPTFWVCNEVQSFDPAFIRRFDYLLEIQKPRYETRQKIIDRYLKSLPVSRQFRERLYHNKDLVPAQIEKATRIANEVNHQDSHNTEQLIEQILNNNLRAMGCNNKPEFRQHRTPYSLAFTHCNLDLQQLIQRIQPDAQARIVLYGPPGTGKTAFAEYLCQHLDKTLIVRQSSDLLGAYVGETENNIADMFYDADAQQAVLLLDEADGFLINRQQAQRSWEVTMVNELLVQMEHFEGIFIAATNLFEQVDEASLRRFDIKICFNFLQPEQHVALARSVLRSARKRLPAVLTAEFHKLRLLTPGDYSAVMRRFTILGETVTADKLLQALQEEQQYKFSRRNQPIGFTTNIRVAG